MIDRTAYTHTGEAIEDWLAGDLSWQKLSDRSHDGELADKVRRLARAGRDSRRDEFRGRALKAVHDRLLKLYLLPRTDADLSHEGKKIGEATNYLLNNPSARKQPTKSIVPILPDMGRKTLDRAKDKFNEIQRWRRSSPTELSSPYLDVQHLPNALYSGDAKKLPLKMTDLEATDGTLYFKRTEWVLWRSSI
jgi:hypothetical protein